MAGRWKHLERYWRRMAGRNTGPELTATTCLLHRHLASSQAKGIVQPRHHLVIANS
jgi:hypothetical protein